MFKRNLKSFVLFIVLSLLSFQNSFADLLPGSVVQIGKDNYSNIENLKINQLIATQYEKSPEEFHQTKIFDVFTLEKYSDKAVVIELTPEEGESGLLMVGCNQYFERQNALTKLKPKLLEKVKKGKKKALQILLNAIWVKAEDLKVGDMLVGKDGQTLRVTEVKPFEFKEKQDFYEISLKHHHMYYLLDTAGNHVLTHNIEPFTICALIVAGCSAIGVVGGVVYAYKRSRREGGPTKKEVATRMFWGSVIGAAVGVGVCFCVYYPTEIKNFFSPVINFIKTHKSGLSILAATLGGAGTIGYEAFIANDPSKYTAVDYDPLI
ncbi:MAG: hypothetical protein SZ59_C0003G0015 [candidate division TM6 bacterium GW2011_GWF2_28_16]|nr:MAG: hypothetical protein SZ59_C0003G0015 [candidate division TM6 bacterium GW2011_GWF2_28_16]